MLHVEDHIGLCFFIGQGDEGADLGIELGDAIGGAFAGGLPGARPFELARCWWCCVPGLLPTPANANTIINTSNPKGNKAIFLINNLLCSPKDSRKFRLPGALAAISPAGNNSLRKSLSGDVYLIPEDNSSSRHFWCKCLCFQSCAICTGPVRERYGSGTEAPGEPGALDI